MDTEQWGVGETAYNTENTCTVVIHVIIIIIIILIIIIIIIIIIHCTSNNYKYNDEE